MQAMIFNTSIQLKDALYFSFYHYYRKGSSKVVLVISFFGILYFLLIYSGHPEDSSLLRTALFLILVYLFIPLAIFFRTRNAYRSGKVFSAPIQWKIDTEAVSAKGNGFDTQYLWSSVAKVMENENTFLIYHSNQNASIIPKRDLTPLEISQFQHLIMSIPGLSTEIWIRQFDGVEMVIKPATRLQRFFNFLLDSIFFLFLYGALTLLFIVAYVKLTPVDADVGPTITLLPYFLILPFYGLYYFISELFFQRSPAKWITKTKVVSITSSPVTLNQIMVRTVARIIPFEGASFIASEEGIHDLISKTRVIRSKPDRQVY